MKSIVNYMMDILKEVPKSIFVILRNNNGMILIDILLTHMRKHDSEFESHIYYNNGRFPFNSSDNENTSFSIYGCNFTKTVKASVIDIVTEDLKKQIERITKEEDLEEWSYPWFISIYVYYFGNNLEKYGITRDDENSNESESESVYESGSESDEYDCDNEEDDGDDEDLND